MARNRAGESTSDWKPEESAVDADKVGLSALLKEFDANYYLIKELTERQEEIKTLFKRHGRNFEIIVGGQKAWRVRSDGALEQRKLANAHPDLVAEYTKMALKPVFDLERFKSEQPQTYKMFRAQRMEKIN